MPLDHKRNKLISILINKIWFLKVILPFDDKLKLKAVLWLARTLDKSISKLTMEDFE